MGHYIVKPTQDEDLYVMMSSIVEEPIAWGPRKRWIKWAKKAKTAHWLGIDESSISSRLDRVDKYSGDLGWMDTQWGDDEQISWQCVGYVLRKDLKWISQLLELGVPVEDDTVKSFVVYTDDEGEPIVEGDTSESEWPNG